MAISIKWFIPAPQKNDNRGGKSINVHPGFDAGTQVFQSICEGVSKFNISRSPRLLHVVTTDGDGIKFWHVLRSKFKDIGNNFHGRRWRIDIGVANHKLFQDIILYRSAQLLHRDSLLLGGNNIKCQDWQHCTVHGHRNRHDVQWDLIEQDLHVEDGVYGNTCLTHVTHNPLMI